MAKYQIACVDDDEAMLATVARCLRREPSFEVRTSNNPYEVLGWIAHEPIAVGGAEPVQLYLLWESELAVRSGTSTQAVLVFAKQTIPYRGSRRYGYARFGAGRVSRR